MNDDNLKEISASALLGDETPSEEFSGIEEEAQEEISIAVPFDPDQIEVTTKAMTIDLILSRIQSGAINLQPDFQRRWGIWSRRRQTRLIESLLLRIPLPTFYAAEDEDENWEIVDGIQRLSTIARFIKPAILYEQPFELEGLEYLHEFEGERYDGLTPRLQRRLRETELIVHLIRHGTPVDVKFNIFGRINTGGMALTAQELRHAIIPGPGRQILEDWAASERFREATAYSVKPDRMNDRELVLRFVAFSMTPYSEYRDKDLDTFLVEAMKRLNVLSTQELSAIYSAFEKAMHAAYRIFGNDAFRKRYNPSAGRSLVNKALFEAMSTTFAQLSDEEIEHLVERGDQVRADFIALCNERAFDSAISQGTNNPNKVAIRFTSINKMIKNILSC
ncbi:DUF262 domain-containing protein [Edaphobacter sp. DSM 109919]|uniref:DUF262 domain-containing protein n=1 Tax=Edaphobacter paludis TaxID=3035702 RepID=A0AAU7CV59_9BACT